MDQLRAIRYFVTAADRGSLSSAAALLGVSTAAVSKLLSALERSLGTTLLDRGGRGVVLTSEGRRYLDQCKHVLSTLEAANAAVGRSSRVARGTLVVGLPPTLAAKVVAPHMARFRSRYPEVKVQLRRAWRASELASAGLDLLLALGWVEDRDYIAKKLAQCRFLICASPGYWSSAGVPATPGELRSHRTLVYRVPEGVVMNTWVFQRGAERAVVRLEPASVCDEQTWLIADALAGGGVLRVIDLAVRGEVQRGELVPVLSEWQGCEAPPVHAIYPRAQRNNHRVKAFIDFAEDLFSGEQQAWEQSGPSAVVPKPSWWGRPLP